MPQGKDGQRAQCLWRAVPSGLVRATPALSPQSLLHSPSAPSIPFPSPHPLLQVLNSLLAHLRWPSPSCWSLHINISSSIPPSDPQSVPSASFQVSVPQPLVTPAHWAPRPHQQRAVAALLPDTSKGIRDSLILLPAAAVPSEPCLSACVQSGDPGRRIQPCLSPSVMAGDAMGLPLGS